METVISSDQKIINTLLLNASFIDNLGLMHGKMGISILFYHLARKYKNKIYEDYAGELIDEIYEEITANTPVNFENGLAGIGWGIEYLVQNKFIEADTDEVLEEFDNRIFKELIYNTPKEIGLLNGIVGIGAYFLKRIQPACRQGRNPASNDEKIPTLTNKQTLINIIDELERKTQTIAEIISEPLKPSNNRQTFEPSNNHQTLEPSNNHQTLEPSNNRQTLEPSNNHQTLEPSNNRQTFEPSNKIFDLTWDYPALLWFLAELYEQNIFNFKVEKIIQRLTKPLTDETNMPKLHSNRLLLALPLTKLRQTLEHSNSQTLDLTGRQANTETVKRTKNKTLNSSNLQILELSNVKTTKTKLLKGTKRDTITIELPPNNTTIKHGSSGITCIYKRLFELTAEKRFKQEMEYWATQSLDAENDINNNSGLGDSTNHKKMVFGILEGKAGTLLNYPNMYHSNTETIKL